MSQATPDRYLVQWSEDLRTCTATRGEGKAAPISLTFRSPEAVTDPIARIRMEEVTVDALAQLDSM